VENIPKVKMCNSCFELKKIENFHKHIASPDKHRSYCRACATLKMRNYRKTGKTYTNEFEHKDIKELESILANLTLAFNNHGYTIYRRKFK
jgi:hypothetical protein